MEVTDFLHSRVRVRRRPAQHASRHRWRPAGTGAANAATVTYLTPVVGIASGALVLDETVTWSRPLGAAVVVLGIAVSRDRLRRPTRTPAAADDLEDRGR